MGSHRKGTPAPPVRAPPSASETGLAPKGQIGKKEPGSEDVLFYILFSGQLELSNCSIILQVTLNTNFRTGCNLNLFFSNSLFIALSAITAVAVFKWRLISGQIGLCGTCCLRES